MKKVQNADNHEKALDELFKRYDRRGATYDKSPEFTEQKSREIEMRTNARRANKASREYLHDTNVELDTNVVLQEIDQVRYGKKGNMKKANTQNDIKAKLRAEADRTNPKTSNKNEGSTKKSSKPKKASSARIKEVAREAAKTWIPLEERKTENIKEGGKTKFPTTLILAIIVITISLLMIVGSAVLLGSAKNEQNDLEDKIALLDSEIAELRTDLDKKNAEAYIEEYAKEELGMISQEHVNLEYINSNKTDELEKEVTEKVSLRSLIDWIFHQFE